MVLFFKENFEKKDRKKNEVNCLKNNFLEENQSEEKLQFQTGWLVILSGRTRHTLSHFKFLSLNYNRDLKNWLK
jgi:hypothetical protein